MKMKNRKYYFAREEWNISRVIAEGNLPFQN